MCFPGPIWSAPTEFPTTNGKAMNTMIQQAGPVWRTVVGVRFGCSIVATLSVLFWGGCARVTPSPESTPTDLQVTADSLKTAVREAQRTASELRTELEEQRKELADAQVARAQLQGMLRETERRLADARQVIELQREELASARTERERVAQTMAPLHSRAQHPPVGVRLQRKRASSGQDEVVPAPAETQEQSAVKPLEDGGEAVPQSTPADGEAAPVSDVPQASPIVMPTPSAAEPVRTIVVQGGDTLWRLAHRHKVSLEALKSLNGLPTNLIVAGRTLRLPEPRLQQAVMQPVSLKTLVR
jgi:LysM repeat protein